MGNHNNNSACRPSAGQGQFASKRPAFRQQCYATMHAYKEKCSHYFKCVRIFFLFFGMPFSLYRSSVADNFFHLFRSCATYFSSCVTRVKMIFFAAEFRKNWTKEDCQLASVGPRVWNSLPEDVTSAPSLPVFRRKLKTHLFRHSYPDIVTAPYWFLEVFLL